MGLDRFVQQHGPANLEQPLGQQILCITISSMVIHQLGSGTALSQQGIGQG